MHVLGQLCQIYEESFVANEHRLSLYSNCECIQHNRAYTYVGMLVQV